jgi:hypothetical protein
MMRIFMAALAVFCLIGSSAEARSHHHAGGDHDAGRPGAWCGWYMRGKVGNDPGPTYIISLALGLATDQMLVDRRSGPSSSGVTTSAGSSATRMVNG